MPDHYVRPHWAEDFPPFLTGRDIAAITQISYKTIMRYGKEEVLESIKFGRLRRFPTDPFLMWLESEVGQKWGRKKWTNGNGVK